MTARRKVMQKACHDTGLDQRGNDSLHQPNPWEYFINKKHRLVWCNVFKSGSSRLKKTTDYIFCDPKIIRLSSPFSWMYIFNRLTGLSDRDLKTKKKRTPPVTLARKFYPRPTTLELLVRSTQINFKSVPTAFFSFKEAMKNSVSFIVGRHPLERLVSGFRDKILSALRGSYHENLGRCVGGQKVFFMLRF